jgi:predicted DNA-binding protein YlxM (UPF0122 family)
MVIKSALLDEYLIQTAVTPEEVLLEKERMEEIAALLQLIKGNLSEKQWDILWLYSVEGWTYEEIGIKYGIKRAAICRYIRRITEKLNKLVNNSGANPTISEELFREPQSKLEAHSPETAGYPYEIMQNCSMTGEWKSCGRNGKRWVSKVTCRIPEYLKESFRLAGADGPGCWPGQEINRLPDSASPGPSAQMHRADGCFALLAERGIEPDRSGNQRRYEKDATRM